MNLLLILIGKLALLFSKTFNLGSGSTWPGHVATETNPKFVQQVLAKNHSLTVVLIAGTNGKTTTSLMLQKMLEENGLKVFRNEAGANLLNGIASTIIQKIYLTGRLNYDVAIFEVDENNLSMAISATNPGVILLLNLFRDQLDRYGEVNTIAAKWDEAIRKLPITTTLFTNGDDPKLSDIANDSTLVRYYFGIAENLMIENLKATSYQLKTDSDFAYCPNCNTKLMFSKISYSHLGKFHCPNCRYTNHETEIFPTLPHPLFGKYNIYNTNAAALVAQKAFNVPLEKIKKALEDFKPAFGRQETIKYKNRDVLILLSKNPAGFNQSIDAINSLKKKGNILLILNDRIPDGRDVSWIWDVDFDDLPKGSKIFISGDRAYDMGLRIKYLDSKFQEPDSKNQTNFQIFNDLNLALENAVRQTETDETLFILPTYSAMLDVRKLLTGRSIL